MSVVQHVDWLAIGPPVVLAGTALLALVADLFLPAARRRLVLVGSLTGTLAAIGWSAWLATDGVRATFCTAIQPPARFHVVLLGKSCSYAADPFADYFQILVMAALVVVLLLIWHAVDVDRLPVGETCFLLLASVTGMVVLASARDLVTLVVALEVVSLPAFVLVGLRRRDPRSAQAALTFFIVSVVSTALTIYGMALIYGVTGSLQFSDISAVLTTLRGSSHHADVALAGAAVVLVLAGFVFKIAAVPFHAWAPDTYQGAPLPIAALLSVASKAAGFAGLLALLFGAFRPYADVWGPVVAVVAALTMTVGNLVALRQWNVVRMLAWSTVAQGGYLLVPLGVAATAGGRTAASLHTAEQATLGYLGIYAAMNLGAFAVVAAVGAATQRRAIADYRGLAATAPWLSVALALFLTALAGLPPGVSGLVAKVVILRAAVGHVTWLAVVAAVNTVIGLAYYLRLAALPFLGISDPRPADDSVTPPESRRSVAALGAVGIAALATVWLSVDPQPLLHAASAAASL